MDATTVNVICGLIRHQAAASEFGCSLDWSAPADVRLDILPRLQAGEDVKAQYPESAYG